MTGRLRLTLLPVVFSLAALSMPECSCRFLSVVALVLACAFSAPVRGSEVAARVAEGRAALRAAASGQDGAADRALAAFGAALRAAPDDPMARAGRGLAYLAQALEAPVARKLPLARRGCADLDGAVAAAPDNLEIRLMRATSAVQMPLLLERRALAEADFRDLLVAARDATVTMPATVRRSIFYQAAAFALKERRSEAVDLLETAALIDAAEPSDDQVQSMLALARRQLTSPSHADRPSNHEEASASGP